MKRLAKTVPLRKFRLVCDNALVHIEHGHIGQKDREMTEKKVVELVLQTHMKWEWMLKISRGKKTDLEMFESGDSACELTDDDETNYWYEQQGEQELYQR